MAQVTQVQLHPLRVLPATGEVAVEIDYEIVFTRAESGRRYEVVIDLVGEESPEPMRTTVGESPAPPHSFAFRGAIPLTPSLTERITVEPGQLVHTNTIIATLDRALLAEAPGVTVIPSPLPMLPWLTFVLPHPTEIRARVSVRHHAFSSGRRVPVRDGDGTASTLPGSPRGSDAT